jgi:phenylacetic acid degradation operon negative regulatory protein
MAARPPGMKCHSRIDDRQFKNTIMHVKLRPFHHPDVCPTVLRRRACEAVLDTLVSWTGILVTRGRYLLQTHYDNDSSYRSAIHRLKKEGLIAYRRTGGRMPVLVLTEAGERSRSPACRRRPPWPTKWNGIWYLLTYDVPETSRPYRTTLRAFLKKKRMGWLQKSVCITPSDIRPEFDDLVKAGGLDEFAYLFESRSVLGRSTRDVVVKAWPMDRVERAQRWYLEVYKDNLKRLRSGSLDSGTLAVLAREELSAYVTVMEEDPFLPRPLWPHGYVGEKAWTFHRTFSRELAKHL